jgi:hypothetical protein
MWLLTSLMDRDSSTSNDWYLGSVVQNRLKPLKEKKLAIVAEKLQIVTIERPSVSVCNIDDEKSIFSFLARENLDCAFHCEPDTSEVRVSELCDIIKNDIPKDWYIHITIHPNIDTATQEKSASDMFWYFEVWIKDTQQDIQERYQAITRFKTFFIQTKQWSQTLS